MPDTRPATTGTIGGYLWHAYYYGEDHQGIEVQQETGGWTGCPHAGFDIEPSELAAMTAALAEAKREYEARP